VKRNKFLLTVIFATVTGHCKATEKDGAPGTPGKGIWSKKFGRRASGTAGGRLRQQHGTEMELLNGVEWCVAYAPPGMTGHESSKSITLNTLDSNPKRRQVVAQLNHATKEQARASRCTHCSCSLE